MGAAAGVLLAINLFVGMRMSLPGDDVDENTLLQSSELEVNGERFRIHVFGGSGGRFFAKTCLGEDDFIITDGHSLPETLKRHESLLPLAIGSRELTQSYLGFTRRFRPRRHY